MAYGSTLTPSYIWIDSNSVFLRMRTAFTLCVCECGVYDDYKDIAYEAQLRAIT